jgi:methionyl-tRNA formyltransferase
MRVVMFGYQTWGHRTLQALLDSGHEVALAVTHPKSDHAYEKVWDDSVAELAEKHGVPVEIRNRPDESLVDRLREVEPDVIVATNWRTWIPPSIFRLPRLGTLNVHDSLLPAYAGFAPLIWALINGEEQVGVTAHMMDDDLDAGDIVLQRAVPVGPADTATDLFHRTLELFGPITVDGLALISTGASTGAGRPRTSNGWCGRSPTRTRTPSPTTADSDCGSWARPSLPAATAARRAGSSSGKGTAWSSSRAPTPAAAATTASWSSGYASTTAPSCRRWTISPPWAGT